ncbi:hypothetical protein TSOC_000702 [Tetrabaena socialis]|uniref:MEKHLA domain-containing protein n=1 Tax=Tetrabaena socialis TaxID=47790 RepID=A0A2J8AIP9_9CHLO|nr:hypothetical protein TSOC_000702 [Tetrabaena socialis]|eukprot:PNH12396.1 hypothetical protein TSOC_000702 [Tetrabaena socialis]
MVTLTPPRPQHWIWTILANTRTDRRYLIEGADFEALAAAAYRAPFVLLAHNRFQEGVTDPLFTYANRAALELWETTWDDIIGTPSRLSAPDVVQTQTERQELLDRAAAKGVVTNYEGWRVSAKGRRFKIRDVVLFNIVDRQGTKLGQAAMFSRYELESGLVMTVTAAPREEEEEEAGTGGVPTPEDMAAAEAAVAEQAAHVRALKEVQGLTNQDIPVQMAVLKLKENKEQLVKLQRRLEDALLASRAAFDDDDDE